MGNFLIVIGSQNASGQRQGKFWDGLRFAESYKLQTPAATLKTTWASVAAFARRNGTGGSIAQDPQTGSWLLTSGTWFHKDGFGSAHTSKLLDRYLVVSAKQLARELDGFFVIAIGDARTSELVLITDPMGSCHAYSQASGNVTAISSSSLLLASLEYSELDAVGCQEFLLGGVSYEDRTAFPHVNKLKPATILTYRNGVLVDSQRYWSFRELAPESLTAEKAVEGLWDSLTSASLNILRDFPRTCCDLTGGYDSRALVAAFSGTASSFATVVSGPDTSPDVIVSEGLSKILGMPHLHLYIPSKISFSDVKRAHALTDGEFDPVEYTGILSIHETLLQKFDISINGSYGGIARALWWEVLAPGIGARKKLDSEKLARARYVLPNVDNSLFPAHTRIDLGVHLAAAIDRLNDDLFDLPNSLQMDHANLNLRIHRWQGRIASSTNQLWPCLSPFGLRSVLETVLQSSTQLRLRSNLVRHMLAKYQPRLADYPLERGFPATPATWSNFYKFAPVVTHLGARAFSKFKRTVFGPGAATQPHSGGLPFRLQLLQEQEVQELLNPSTMKSLNLFDPQALGQFLKRAHDPHFPFAAQWNRLLSLEHSIRLVQRAHEINRMANR